MLLIYKKTVVSYKLGCMQSIITSTTFIENVKMIIYFENLIIRLYILNTHTKFCANKILLTI